MPPLPRLTASELRRALHRLGFVEDRQRGSRLILRCRDDPGRYAVLPVHSRGVIPPGTLHHILRTAQIRPEDLSE
ncbi:MAG: type II toxin-antitoxin system HicA family toxin [Firmicutes bacterium]|nr:type II toxin-antitoxin system HicA family toxin [Bacillota bacterium]